MSFNSYFRRWLKILRKIIYRSKCTVFLKLKYEFRNNLANKSLHIERAISVIKINEILKLKCIVFL